MRRFDLKIWENYTKNLIGLVALGSLGSFWTGSAGNSTQKAAMFSQKVVL